MTDEWIYSRPFTNDQDRAGALPAWLHTYKSQPPITRVTNGPGHYT